jgi:hypothetical protein
MKGEKKCLFECLRMSRKRRRVGSVCLLRRGRALQLVGEANILATTPSAPYLWSLGKRVCGGNHCFFGDQQKGTEGVHS